MTASFFKPFELKAINPAPPQKKRVLVLAGPTAVGKTQFSIRLAQSLGGEIVSADSAQVYRGMDIGTAKVSFEERALITHHLIDICDLDETFNVAEFYKASQEIFREIFSRQNTPIVVGGSGFYIHSLLYGPPLGPPSNPKVRSQIENQMEEMGPAALYERIQLLDPVYAATFSENDRHKIIRALEIMTLSEQRVSDFQKKESLVNSEWDFRCWFLYYPKDKLYQRIAKRCQEMIRKGLLEEVRFLKRQGIESNRTASQAIGYRQALTYLQSGETEQDFSLFESSFEKATRQYAKRQFTWFRKEPLFRWIDLDATPIEKAQEMILHDFEQGS